MFTDIFSLNESKDNLINSYYFTNYNTLVFSVTSSIDDKFQSFLEKLNEMFGLTMTIPVVRYITLESKIKNQYIRITYRIGSSVFDWGYSALKSFSKYATSDRLTYKRIFSYDEIKKNLNTILNSGDIMPSYKPKKFDRTLESLRLPKSIQLFTNQSPWDVIIFRYYTREGLNRTKEFIKQLQIFNFPMSSSSIIYPADMLMILKTVDSLRRNTVYEVGQDYYDSGDLQKQFPTVVICPTILHMDHDTEEAENLFNTFIFRSFPDYKPKRFNRSTDVNEALSDNVSKYSIYCENRKKAVECEKLLHDWGWCWFGTDNFIIRDNPYLFDSEQTYLDFDKKTKSFRGNIHRIDEAPYHELIYPDDIDKIRNIFSSVPNYEPKKFDRTLEAFKNKLYNNAVFKATNPKENELIQNELIKFGFRWEYSDTFKVREFDISYYPVYIFAETTHDRPLFQYMNCNSLSDYNGSIKKYVDECIENGQKICPTVFGWQNAPFIETILRNGSSAPSYKPKKFDRTLESLNENLVWIGNNNDLDRYDKRPRFKIGDIVRFKPNMIELDKEAYRKIGGESTDNNAKWIKKNMGMKFVIKEYAYDTISDVWLAYVTLGGYKLEDGTLIKQEGQYVAANGLISGIPPNYEPKKFDRTLESLNTNKVLWAFDLDDTLVYSTRFEETVKPLLNEFLTPEIILQNKVADIGVTIKDLKYEHGRIYLEDPKQIINISRNSSWIRKGDRVYITQPESYYLTDESMPIGTYKKIVEVYNKVENRAIITSRNERLRKQTELALNNLGVKKPNVGLFMFPNNISITQTRWKANKLSELYNEGFTEIHYFDDNMKVLKKIKSYLKKQKINITFYKVNENNYRKV